MRHSVVSQSILDTYQNVISTFYSRNVLNMGVVIGVFQKCLEDRFISTRHVLTA